MCIFIMTTADLKGLVPGWTIETGHISEVVELALPTADTATHHSSARASVQYNPKLELPTIDIGITPEEWRLFKRRWRIYVTSRNIPNNDAATQLN